MFKWIFLYFSLCPLPLALSLDTTENILSLSSFISPVRHLYMLIRFPRERSQSWRQAALVPAQSAVNALAQCAGRFPELGKPQGSTETGPGATAANPPHL